MGTGGCFSLSLIYPAGRGACVLQLIVVWASSGLCPSGKSPERTPRRRSRQSPATVLDTVLWVRSTSLSVLVYLSPSLSLIVSLLVCWYWPWRTGGPCNSSGMWPPTRFIIQSPLPWFPFLLTRSSGPFSHIVPTRPQAVKFWIWSTTPGSRTMFPSRLRNVMSGLALSAAWTKAISANP